jgi:hypothetical protein
MPETGQPAWTPPTGPPPAIAGSAQAQNFFQTPCFWLIAAAVVLFVMCQGEGKESDID